MLRRRLSSHCPRQNTRGAARVGLQGLSEQGAEEQGSLLPPPETLGHRHSRGEGSAMPRVCHSTGDYVLPPDVRLLRGCTQVSTQVESVFLSQGVRNAISLQSLLSVTPRQPTPTNTS